MLTIQVEMNAFDYGFGETTTMIGTRDRAWNLDATHRDGATTVLPLGDALDRGRADVFKAVLPGRDDEQEEDENWDDEEDFEDEEEEDDESEADEEEDFDDDDDADDDEEEEF